LSLNSLPPIDPRSATDVADQLKQLLPVYAPGWKEVDPVTEAPMGASAALIRITARFAEVLIQRLNRVPQKNFLAYLDLLGAALQPPQPARAPVTFLLSQGTLVDTLVPVGTQVAAPPGAGDTAPIIYETENEMVATPARLVLAIVRDPDEDACADYSKEIIAVGSSGTSVFHGNRQIAHDLYLGLSQFLNSRAIANLIVTVDLSYPAGDGVALKWEIWTGAEWRDITPLDSVKDGTRNLRQSGAIQFGPVPAAQTLSLGGSSKEWIRCRLLTPIANSTSPRSGMIRAGRLPVIREIGVQVHLHSSGLWIDQAYSSAIGLIDTSRDFYPFGEKPRFNDTLWLASEEAFSNPGAAVTIDVVVTNSPGSNVQVPALAAPSEDLKLRWEVWNGAWIELGASTRNGLSATVANGRPFSDTTNAFSKTGKVTFALPPGVARFSVNGKESFWVRVRISSGNYGLEGRYEADKAAPSGFRFILPTFRPPSIHSITVAYDLDRPAPPPAQVLPEAILAENDSTIADLTPMNGVSGQSFAPFRPSADERPTLYLGFVLPIGRTSFPNTTITMFFRAAALQYGEKTVPLAPDVSRRTGEPGTDVSHTFVVTNPGTRDWTCRVSAFGNQWSRRITLVHSDGSSGDESGRVTLSPGDWAELRITVTVPDGAQFGESDRGILKLVAPDQLHHSAEFETSCHENQAPMQQLQLTWEYWNGEAWGRLIVRDETSNLAANGIVEFLSPRDFSAHAEFGAKAWWLRVRWDSGDYDTDPRIDRVLLNTTMAKQAVTVSGEVLGSSDGGARQSFRTAHAPVLAGQSLAVREPEAPTGEELKTILKDSGLGAVVTIAGSAGKPSENWVAWQEVTDFYASDSRSRHYTLDHIMGVVSFGDGQNGMIPPVGSANIRLTSYRTGGGVRGNRPAGSIVQLKTTVPYVDKVMNAVEASGGVDAESIASLIARAPREIRHRHRAVTPEDYEDLAHVASADVVRALCVPNRNLVADPFDQMPPLLGNVSLIIVPNSADPRPRPSVELVQRVQRFIAASCPVTANVLVIGPLYLRVDVQVEIGLTSLDNAGMMVPKVQNALAAFLHPLTGGPDGEGWQFGREPHRSDIYGVIEPITGVDHIRALTVETTATLPGARETGRFLVYSGNHDVKLVFQP
jgi:hypothetical protein